jgi:hypothetical protein
MTAAVRSAPRCCYQWQLRDMESNRRGIYGVIKIMFVAMFVVCQGVA